MKMAAQVKSYVDNLIDISKKIGLCPEFVQGGGGNTSVKINDNLMAIKASGYLLKDMSENDGFSFVNYLDIKNHIKSNKISGDTEDDFSAFIKEKTSKIEGYPNLKPSIETGFHALLPQKYIIHTHSVYANIICCSKDGEDTAQKLFPSSIWVKYANPGKDITIAIANVTKDKPSNIIFMQNHGIIICAKSSGEAYNLHKSVNNKIINHFNIGIDFELEKIDLDIEEVKEKVIFPDQVVYLLSENLRNSASGLETLYAYNYIIKKIKNLGLTPNFISKKDINYIENMESEKYRTSLIRK